LLGADGFLETALAHKNPVSARAREFEWNEDSNLRLESLTRGVFILDDKIAKKNSIL